MVDNIKEKVTLTLGEIGTPTQGESELPDYMSKKSGFLLIRIKHEQKITDL